MTENGAKTGTKRKRPLLVAMQHADPTYKRAEYGENSSRNVDFKKNEHLVIGAELKEIVQFVVGVDLDKIEQLVVLDTNSYLTGNGGDLKKADHPRDSKRDLRRVPD